MNERYPTMMHVPHRLLVACLILAGYCSAQNTSQGSFITKQSRGISVRLFNATNAGKYIYGGVELSSDLRSWGFPCEDEFFNNNGLVVCRMLGFQRGEVVAGGRLGHSAGVPYPDQLDCLGSEVTLADCEELASLGECDPDQGVGVICFNNTKDVFEMRVVDGKKTEIVVEGRLEVRLTPITGWGAVCDDSFSDRAATAACTFMGYKYGEAQMHTGWDWLFADSGIYGSAEETLLDEVQCGLGQDFLECDHSSWGYHDCDGSEDVGVLCSKSSVRLLSAVHKDYHIGTVEVYLQKYGEGGWYEVCDASWDDKDAKVVCRELGFTDGISLQRNSLGLSSFGSFTIDGSVTRVRCDGSESDLISCPMEETDLCEFHGNVIDLAAVICYDKPVSQINMTDEVRLAADPNSPPNAGFLEVRHKGVWGRVCEDDKVFQYPPVSDKEANVTCRMMGYTGGKRLGPVNIGDEDHHIWLRGFSCKGNESTIAECSVPSWGSPGQSVCKAPVRIACYKTELKLSLAGSSIQTGILNLVQDGQTAEICAGNWTNREAEAACKSLGFMGGRTWSPAVGSMTPVSTSMVLRNVSCNDSKDDFFTCVRNWTVPASQCSKGAAGVTCFKTVKIDPGVGATGILQAYNKASNQWTTICRTEFDDVDATVACKDVGYTQGKALPMAAFGPYTSRHGRSQVNCTGSEASILDCPYSQSDVGCDSYRSYASVSCFNTSIAPGTYRLENGYIDSTEASGILKIYQNSTWGYACDESFSSEDARVFCAEIGRTLGYTYVNGTKYTPAKNIIGPYFVTYPNCTKDNVELRQCRSGRYLCTEQKAVSLLCYTSEAPKLQLVNDPVKINSGRLQISINGHLGAICGDNWTDADAIVACMQLSSKYSTGAAKLYDRGGLPFFMSGLKCSGQETSLFQCDNDGWRSSNSNPACRDSTKEAGVVCYTNVVIKDEKLTSESLSGRLSVIKFGRQYDVCFDETFTHKEALLACSELGYSYAALLKPFRSSELDEYYMMKRFSCAGSDISLAACQTVIGSCRDGQVRILCYQNPVNYLGMWTIKNGNTGPVTINLMNLYTGVICPTNFGDKEANATCHGIRLIPGKVLGSPRFTGAENELVWFGPPVCSSTSNTGPSSCIMDPNVPRECFEKDYSAGVICFQKDSEVRIRLMDNQLEAKMGGRVEIFYNQQWGTVCNKNGGRLQARVLCQELGYVDGGLLNAMPKRYGPATGPIYLKDVSCTSENKQFLGCSNSGWGNTSDCTHDDDLEIVCYSKERLYPDPEKSYGAVSVLVNGAYRLVCSDNFTNVEAGVLCRSLKYTTGISICCSALRVPYLEIGVSGMNCQGAESSLLECRHNVAIGVRSCPSQEFASAACSMSSQPDTYVLTLERASSGAILLEYYGVKGLVCFADFDHRDAQVACREAGFYTGLAFSVTPPTTIDVSWTSSLQCQGSEQNLRSCPKFELGKTSRCKYAASVKCLNQNDDKEIRIRLAGGSRRNIGRLEVQINGTWGSVCHFGNTLPLHLPSIVCKELGFVGGQMMAPGSYGASPGPVFLEDVICSGGESALKECQLVSVSMDVCHSHLYDVAIECFLGARLVNGPARDGSQGQLQIQNKGTNEWQYICDTGITDREATIACKSLGYAFGKTQCCNASGLLSDRAATFVTSITCSGVETDITTCSVVRTGVCNTSQYAYVHCSNTAFTQEDLTVKSLPEFVGTPEVSRFGMVGVICADDFKDSEANVICRELGYLEGLKLQPSKKLYGSVFMLRGLSCSGAERTIRECKFPNLADAGACSTMMTAQVLCKKSNNNITFSLKPLLVPTTGQAEITIDGRTFLVDNYGLGNREASVFCRSIKSAQYVYGELHISRVPGTVLGSSILMTNVNCVGNETNFLQCGATFMPKFSNISATRLAAIQCHTGVELTQGLSENSGILTLYNEHIADFGAICNVNFGQTEADVACRMFGMERGVAHCCMPFGYNYYEVDFKNFKCSGTETSLYSCNYESAKEYSPYYCNRQNYVGITCYNGTKPAGFDVSLDRSSASSNTGLVQIKYMGTPGTVCSDDWDDKDAQVACRELGYQDGIAYSHFRSTFVMDSDAGPFWLANVQCTGTERKLADCPHSGLGNVTKCERGDFAGVLCTQGSETAYRIAGTDYPHYGRLEVRIDGRWGTVCNRYWDIYDATVVCRQLGYASGDVFSTSSLEKGQGPVWEIGARCSGKEANLNLCSHEGWKADVTSSCADHLRDAGVFCYKSVRLATDSGKNTNNGPVLYYENNDWYRVCDDDFTDMSARKVCQELGFYDGRAICCSAYMGESFMKEGLHPNITIQCTGDETSLKQCVQVRECKSGLYASVLCIEVDEEFNETEYTFSLKKDFEGAGRLEVTHMGEKGRICSIGWTDIDAKIFCKSIGYPDGFAYYFSHTREYSDISRMDPYWISNVTCLGNETSLNQCKFQGRKELGNCSNGHSAGVVCFKQDGVEYRLNLEGQRARNYGRVEMAIDGRWGTICGEAWDDQDARVACRYLKYKDGEAEANGKYGAGTGPVWLKDIQCKGTESVLHQCPHTGYQNALPDTGSSFPWQIIPCSGHDSDATVFCFSDVKLNQRLSMSSGALLYNYNDKWVHVCDSNTFTQNEARVACKGLLRSYVDGVPISGGVYGEMKHNIEIQSVTCTGSESTLSECQVSAGSQCDSKEYISVSCFEKMLTPNDLKFQVRLSEDSIKTDDNHGILEIRQRGAWGRICMHEFTDKEAEVACKELGQGFIGGVVYLHLYRNRLPILWSKATCSGNEISLLQCQHDTTKDNENCAYDSNDAGVLCFKGEGVKYRLQGGQNPMSGRVEIGIDGNYSTVCAINWHANNARVLCKNLGYVDGIPTHTTISGLPPIDPLMSFFLCEGNEKDLLSCLNSGFDGGNRVLFCGGDAYSMCFNEEIKVTGLRLGDGETSQGRVEVYVTGLNAWGSVCDDDWDNADARVVCRSLGFDDGVVIHDGFKEGKGYVLLDNVECNGTETTLADCEHNGVNSHNCDHAEDAGVRCFNNTTTVPPVTTMTSSTTSTTTPSTTSGTVSSSTTTSTRRTSTTSTTLKTSTRSTTTTSTARTTSSSSTSSTSTSTTTSTSTSPARPAPTNEQSKGDEDKKTKVIVAAVITIILAIVLIAVVVFVVIKYKGRTKSEIPHERFHDVMHADDGSVAVSNQMYDISNPEGGDPMTHYMPGNSEVHLAPTGFATYSKGTSPHTEENGNHPDGFTNPLYAAMKNSAETGLDDINLNVDKSDPLNQTTT